MKKSSVRSFESLKLNESFSLERTFTAVDLETFSNLSGDYNPLHIDNEYASSTVFGKRVVYGMLIGALASALVGMHLPGERALLLKTELEFKKPVFIGDMIILEGTILKKSSGVKVIVLGLKYKRAEETVAVGKAYVHVRT